MESKNIMGISGILIVFVALMIGVPFFQSVAQQQGAVLDLVSETNTSITAPAIAGTYAFTKYQQIDSIAMINATDGTEIPATNYSIANKQVVNGQLASVLTMKNSTYAGNVVKVTVTGQPIGYVSDSGSRAIVSLILVVFALAIFTIPLSIIYREEIMDYIGR